MKKAEYVLQDPTTKIYVGDCRIIASEFKDGFFDLCFADPPFNNDSRYENWDDNMSNDEYMNFTYTWLTICIAKLKKSGSLFVNVPDQHVAMVASFLDKSGLTLVNWIIWHYRFGQCLRSKFIKSKQHVLYYVRDYDESTWNPDDVLVASDRATVYSDARTQKSKTPGMRMPFDVWYGDGFNRIQGNNKERSKYHPNQLPESYMERIIQCCSDEGDRILDPFLGSGTSLVVARALGRKGYGIEIGKKYAKHAYHRVKCGPVHSCGAVQ